MPEPAAGGRPAMPMWKMVAVATTIGLAVVTGVLFVRTSDAMVVVLGGLMVAALWLAVGATRMLLRRALAPPDDPPR